MIYLLKHIIVIHEVHKEINSSHKKDEKSKYINMDMLDFVDYTNCSINNFI